MAIVLACLATVGALAAQPADASPNRILSGWIPYWLSGSTSASGIASAIANASLFTDVSPFWFTAVPGGANGTQVIINKAFANGVAAAAADTQALHAAGIPVLPTVTDGMGRGGMAAILPIRQSELHMWPTWSTSSWPVATTESISTTSNSRSATGRVRGRPPSRTGLPSSPISLLPCTGRESNCP